MQLLDVDVGVGLVGRCEHERRFNRMSTMSTESYNAHVPKKVVTTSVHLHLQSMSR